MHLLYVIDSLAPGGAEQSLVNLAPHYAERGVRLTVAYLTERRDLGADLEARRARVVSLAGDGGRIVAARRARTLIRELRPDLVHTTLFEADLAGRTAARLAGVRVVSSLVNEAYGPMQIRDRRLRRWKVRGARWADAATARFVTRFHAVSYQVADVMAVRLHVPRDRIDVVHRGRDPDRLGPRTPERRARARAALGIEPEAPLVLAAARHEYQKGLDVLLAAFPTVRRRIPHARLVIAGREGNQTPELAAAASDLGDAVRLLGARDDVGDLLCAADVLVLPTRWEGLPGTLLEAMAMATPIVASDVPAVREAVDDASALLVPPDHVGALGTAIVTSLTDPDAAGRRAGVARARFVRDFAIEGVADRMVAFYERAWSA